VAIEREGLTPAEDAIVSTLYELVSNLHGAEIGPIKDHMEARFPWLDAKRVVAIPSPSAEVPNEAEGEQEDRQEAPQES
jgi:hypothetical protein